MNNEESGKKRAGFTMGATLFTGCVFALSMGCLDIITSMLRVPPGFRSFVFVLPPLVAAAIVAALSYAAVVLAFSVAARILKASVRECLVPFLVFLATLFTLAGLADLIPLSVLGEDVSAGDYLFKAGLLALLACPAAAGVRLLLISAARWPKTARALTTLPAGIPFLLAEALVFVWLEKYRLAFFSMASLVTIAGFACVFLTTGLFFYLAGRTAWAKALVAILTVAALLSPLATVRAMSRARHSTGLRLTASGEHAVKRVILVVVDTLRADALTCYGGSDPAPTPHIDRLAEEGLLFRHAVSPGPWTVPAMGSMMTGVSPLTHGMKDFGARLPEEFKTLAEHMHDGGYLTAGIGDNGNLKAALNFDQGFAYYDWFPKHEFGPISFGSSVLGLLFPNRFTAEPTTPHLVDLASDWIRRNQDNDFFLWLHLYDPHMPYAPPAEFAPKGLPPQGFGLTFTKKNVQRAMTGKTGRTEVERKWVKGLYNGEVRLVDANIGRFMDTLKAWGLYDDALIVFTADHGEEFWEHGDFEHGQSLYGEMLNVPLIVKLPGATARGVIDTTVSTEAILPTILDLCGLPVDGSQLASPSLAALCESVPGQFTERPVLSTGLMRGDEREAVTDSRFKYIQSLVTSREELYGLAADPGEQVDIARTAPRAVEDPRAALSELREEAASLKVVVGLAEEKEKPAMDEDTEETLRSMGYLD